MKTVMNKIFSLMLVAVLLVSAVPFAASADETEATTEATEAVTETTEATTEATEVTTEATEATTEATEAAEVVTETVAATEETKPTTYTVRFSVDGNDSFWYLDVISGKTVKDPGFEYATDYTYLEKNVGDSANRIFMGWSHVENSVEGYPLSWIIGQPVYENRTYYAVFKDIAVAPPTSSNGNGITNKDNTNKVYLHVYLNGNASTIALTKDITDSYLLDDDKTSNAEIWTYLKNNYYTSNDANVGLLIDGLYVSTGNEGTFPQNYYTDTKQDTLSDIEALRDQGYVHINVMLKNAVVKGTYTADGSNPKTGDMIMAPVAVMGLSVSALAVLLFLNKKRAF